MTSVTLQWITPDAASQLAYMARISNTAAVYGDDGSKLIKRLIEHKEWSPLEMIDACLLITTTRDVSRQLLRHRSFSFQEFSQRYADPTKNKLKFSPREARAQNRKNRQSSTWIPANSTMALEWNTLQTAVSDLAVEAYQRALDLGIAKEVARAILPEGMETRLYMKGNMRSWYHYVQLRNGESTQQEHRELAMACYAALAGHVPMLFNEEMFSDA